MNKRPRKSLDTSLLDENLSSSMIQLESLAQKLSANKEGIDKYSNDVLDSKKYPEGIKESLISMEIEKAISNSILAFERSEDYESQIGNIENILNINKNLNEDLVLIENGLTDADFICPYTQKIFERPMKNSSSKSCIHHISEQALNSMLSGKKSSPCPVAGCQGIWTKGESKLDRSFHYKMERYFKFKNIAKNAEQSLLSNSGENIN